MYTNKYICIKGICPGFKLSEKKTEFSLVNFLWEVLHLVRTYVGVRNNSFSENFADVLNGSSLENFSFPLCLLL